MNYKSNHLLLLLGDEVKLEEATFSSMISNSRQCFDHYKLTKLLVNNKKSILYPSTTKKSTKKSYKTI